MNTFLVSYNLSDNFKKIDEKRLFKQVLEAVQLLDGIVNNKKSWERHPARLMWKNNPGALFSYVKFAWEECKSRKIAVNSKLYLNAETLYLSKVGYNYTKEQFPSWWGREDIAASHRSRLRCKGFIDAACVDIKRDLKLKSIDRWLQENFKCTKSTLKFHHLKLLKQTAGVEFKTPSHYEQFGWTDNPAGEYVWPI